MITATPTPSLPANVNEDAFSDLFGVSGTSLLILHGHFDRTFTEQDVSLLADASSIPVAVDLNGDGIKDLALIEGSDVLCSWANRMGATKRNKPCTPPAVFSRFSRAGITATQSRIWWLRISQIPATMLEFSSFFSMPQPESFPLANRLVQALASPYARRRAEPAWCHRSSLRWVPPLRLALRKTEVWIDGVKVQESFNSYANYSFLDGSLNLAAGSHRADVYSAGYDNRLQLRDDLLQRGNFVFAIRCVAVSLGRARAVRLRRPVK